MVKNGRTGRLLEEIRELEQSSKNIERKNKWECIPSTSRDQWRGLPRLDSSWKNDQIPVQVDMNMTFWAKYFNFSLKDYYLDPEIFLENYLKIKIERFKLFDDDVFVNKAVPVWMATGYEASLFGMDVKYFDDADPWIVYDDVIKEHSDLDRLEMPDFRTSGLMPDAIRIYEYVRENVDDDFEVIFPEWLRGPFGIALYLRGYEHLLMDMVDYPEFTHRFMQFIVDSRKNWFKQLEGYLGHEVKKSNLFNDEVNCPSLSPNLYEEFVLPYEQQLCESHSEGYHYWHSCGDLTRLYPIIDRIPKIDMIHKSPWSSAREAGRVFGKRSAIEVCMNPQGDILESNHEQMKSHVEGIVKELYETDAKGFTLRANNIYFYKSYEATVAKAADWISACRKVSKEVSA